MASPTIDVHPGGGTRLDHCAGEEKTKRKDDKKDQRADDLQQADAREIKPSHRSMTVRSSSDSACRRLRRSRVSVTRPSGMRFQR